MPESEPRYDQWGVLIPQNSKTRISDLLRQSVSRRVDHNGWPLPTKAVDPGVTTVVSPPAAKRAMVEALIEISAEFGVDAATLTDSEDFVRQIGAISPADSESIRSVVRAAAGLPAGMQPNPAQGAQSTGPLVGESQTMTEKMRDVVDKSIHAPKYIS